VRCRFSYGHASTPLLSFYRPDVVVVVVVVIDVVVVKCRIVKMKL